MFLTEELTMIKNILMGVGFVGIILLIGAVGSMETMNMEFKSTIIWIIIGLLFIFISYLGNYLYEQYQKKPHFKRLHKNRKKENHIA